MKTVLITGAAGFIGSNLSKRYLEEGWRVVGIDDFSTSMGRQSPHVLDLVTHENFTLLEEDVVKCTPSYLLSKYLTVSEEKFDLILNFACPASPPRYQVLSLHTLDTCFNGTKNMLELAKKNDCPIVHASTSEVYGDPEISPQVESYKGCVNTWGPRANYDEGKRVAEAICYEYLTKHNIDVRVIRIFNTYGPNMDPDDGRVVTNFVKQALQGEPLTVYGDGKQTRSFCYIDDLVNAIYKMGEKETGNYGSPINVGNPSEFTMLMLATLVAYTVDPKTEANIVFEPLPQDDPLQRRPCINVASRFLDWEPQVGLVDGMREMVKYMKTVLR